jgi:hypothetical protein
MKTRGRFRWKIERTVFGSLTVGALFHTKFQWRQTMPLLRSLFSFVSVFLQIFQPYGLCGPAFAAFPFFALHVEFQI